jgi:hypothetical protein
MKQLIELLRRDPKISILEFRKLYPKVVFQDYSFYRARKKAKLNDVVYRTYSKSSIIYKTIYTSSKNIPEEARTILKEMFAKINAAHEFSQNINIVELADRSVELRISSKRK